MTRYFWFISLLGICCSCHRNLSISADYTLSDQIDEQRLVYFVEVNRDSLKSYNTTVETYGKYFSGVTYVKNMHDSTLRVLFTTHTGMKLVDLELKNNGCTTKYVVEQMNNEMVLKLLCHDFKLLTGGLVKTITPIQVLNNKKQERIVLLKGDKDLYYYLSEGNQVNQLVETVAGKKKIQTVFSRNQSDSSLRVKHYNFNFELNFKNVK